MEKFKEKILIYLDKIKNDLKNVYDNCKNKKVLIGSCIAWVAVFLAIVVISNVSDTKPAYTKPTGFASDEEPSAGDMLLRDTENLLLSSEDNFEETVTQAEVETETQPETVSEEIKEPETVNVEKLVVSKKPIKDDKLNVIEDRFSSINAADIRTKSSLSYDSEQLIHGIDVSRHNGDIDWAKVKAQGIEYAFIRVGFRGYESGGLCIDSKYENNIKGATANGIKVGVYFFSQAITEQEALEEASLTLSLIKNYNISLPVVLDWETDIGYRTYSGLSRAKLTSIVQTYCNTVKRYGYEPMVYMCKDDFINRVDTDKVTSKYKTWVAWYFQEYNKSNRRTNWFRYGEKMPDMPFQYDVWQYSCKCEVDGIPELTDMNIMIIPKKVYEIELQVSPKDLVINKGESIDLLENVSAKNSEGNTVTSGIIVNVFNSVGKLTDITQAVKNPGKYRVEYKYTDYSAKKVISKEVNLFVRDEIEVYFCNEHWFENDKKTMIYLYDSDKSVSENKKIFQKKIKSEIKGFYYDLLKGVSQDKKQAALSIDNISELFMEIPTESKNTELIIKLSDGYGVEVEKRLLLTIDVIESESETETESEESNENTTENTTEVEYDDIGDNETETEENITSA